MSDAPTPYTPTTAFESFNPSAFPNFGTKVDVELENLSTSVTETQSRLAEIQRDDGQLENAVVRRESLHEDIVLGVGTPSGWVTATDYAANDSVIQSGVWYWATEAHTSGTFATDLASGLWEEIYDFTTVVTAALLSNAVPAGLGGTPGAGTSAFASRADHVHGLTSTPPAALTVGAPAAVGVSTEGARADHVHAIPTPTSVDEGTLALFAEAML